MPLNHDVGRRVHHTWVTGVKDGHVTVVSGSEVVTVAMSQSQSQSQCRSCNRKVTVVVKIARSQGMRRRKDGVLRKLRHHTGK